MRDPEPTHEVAAQEPPAGTVSANTLLRVILILLTIWTLFSGLALLFFSDNADATIAGGQSVAAQRLLGVHILVLALVYGLLAWRREQYNNLLWVPFIVQPAVILVVLVNVVTGKSDLTDVLLPLVVAGAFLALLVFVWRSGQLDVFPESQVLSRFTSQDDDEAVVELPPAVDLSEDEAEPDVNESSGTDDYGEPEED
jgi:hypothetical protein